MKQKHNYNIHMFLSLLYCSLHRCLYFTIVRTILYFLCTNAWTVPCFSVHSCFWVLPLSQLYHIFRIPVFELCLAVHWTDLWILSVQELGQFMVQCLACIEEFSKQILESPELCHCAAVPMPVLQVDRNNILGSLCLMYRYSPIPAAPFP
jgi:hypothetical protein